MQEAAAAAAPVEPEEEDSGGRIIRSEVHAATVESDDRGGSADEVKTTAYRFRLSPPPLTAAAACVDQDGDMLVSRKRRRKREQELRAGGGGGSSDGNVDEEDDKQDEEEGDEEGDVLTVRLQHRTATSLLHVGQQLWRGALILSEAVLTRREELRNRTILELGGGLGLVSIVTARAVAPAAVYLTDMDDAEVLALARANAAANDCGGGRVVVAALDWEEGGQEMYKEEEGGGGTSTGSTTMAGLFEHGPDVILAADCIYDDELTDAFFAVLRRLLWAKALRAGASPPASFSSSPYCLLALEKRPVFSTAHMAVVAHGYDRFREQLALEKDQTPRPLAGLQVPVSTVPVAYLPPDGKAWRGEDGLLELWEIRPRLN